MLAEAYEAAADACEPIHKRWVTSFTGPASFYCMDRGGPPTATAAAATAPAIATDSGYSSGDGGGGGSALGGNSVTAGTPQPDDQ